MKRVSRTMCIAVGLFIGLAVLSSARAGYYNYCNIGSQAYSSVQLPIPIGCPSTGLYVGSDFASDQTWLVPQSVYDGTTTDSTITFTIEANTGANSRLARFTGKVQGTDVTLDFVQAGTAAITPVNKKVAVSSDARTATGSVQMAAAPFTSSYVADPSGWVSGKDIKVTLDGTDPRKCQVTVDMPENSSGSSRTVTVSLFRDDGSQLIGTVVFTQAAKTPVSTYTDSKSVGSQAGSVDFVLSLPDGNTYSWDTTAFKFSAPWLTLAKSPSRKNHTVYLSFNYEANTGTSARDAVFTATIDNTDVSLTVSQEGGHAPTPITPTSDFGPGNASEFYLSSSEKAFVVGVYDLHWSDFVKRSDGYYAYTNPNIVDREKGSGTAAQDHSWCVAYSIINAAIWGGWGYLGGYGYDEDLFGDAMIESGTAPDYYSSLQFVADVLLPETDPYQFNEVCDSGFAQALQDNFADAEKMLVTQVYFDNYTWYGTTYPLISHGVACCGYSLDTSKAISDPNCLKGLFIIDSDNDRETSGGRSSAPNTMTYCPVSWDASRNRYNISNVFGTTGYLSNQDDGETYFFQCRGEYNLRKTTEPVPVPATYKDSTSVGADAGEVQFVLALPNGNTYSWDTTAFKFSAPWLTLAKSPSRNNHTVYLTFNYEANTGTSAREAVFTATIDNAEVTLTVSQAGASVVDDKNSGVDDKNSGAPSNSDASSSSGAPSGSDTVVNEARKHDFGTLTEEVGKIETSAFGTPTNARTYTGVVRDQFNAPVGIVMLNVGKVSKSGQCRVKASVVGLDGKKKKSDTVGAAVPPSGAMHVALSVKDYGTLEVALGADSVAGTLGSYDVLPARVGGALAASKVCFRLEDFDWTEPTMLLDEYLPFEEEFAVDGTRWVLGKAAVIKYKKGELDDDAYEKGLSGGKTNNSGLKLTYNARNGTFKGSFTAFSEDGRGKTPKLKKTRISVTGVVVDGYGYGQATIRNGGTYPVTIGQ